MVSREGGGGGSPSDGLPHTNSSETERNFFLGTLGAQYFLCFLGKVAVSRGGGGCKGGLGYPPPPALWKNNGRAMQILSLSLIGVFLHIMRTAPNSNSTFL